MSSHGVASLAYVGFEVGDVEAWTQFLTTILGAQPSDPSPVAGSAFRVDGYARRLLVWPGEAEDLAALGWELESDDAFDSVVERLRNAGVEVNIDDGLAEARGVNRLAKVNDPAGIGTELIVGPAQSDVPFTSDLVRSGYVTGEMGLGHVVINAPDQEASLRFYCDLLGMGVSDHVHETVGKGFELDVAFLHANQRHHSVAFANAPMRRNIHHFMLEVGDVDDVGLALDRCYDHGIEITQSIGRHANDRALSFYARTPSRFEFEIGWDTRRVVPHSTPGEFDTRSEWGHRRPA